MHDNAQFNYPLPAAALQPSWMHRRSQALGAVVVMMCLMAISARVPFALAEIDDIALRILLPAGLGFVLAFSPVPGTAVGRIARDLTVLGLCASMFAGDHMPILLACYPLVLMTSVVAVWAKNSPVSRNNK